MISVMYMHLKKLNISKFTDTTQKWIYFKRLQSDLVSMGNAGVIRIDFVVLLGILIAVICHCNIRSPCAPSLTQYSCMYTALQVLRLANLTPTPHFSRAQCCFSSGLYSRNLYGMVELAENMNPLWYNLETVTR